MADHGQIARAFVVPEATVAQRITRAKRKISDAAIPYRIPSPDELDARLSEVLAVVYLLLNEGYLSTTEAQCPTSSTTPNGWPTCSTPSCPRTRGRRAPRPHPAPSLLAGARFDPDGRLSCSGPGPVAWDQDLIADATQLLVRLPTSSVPGPTRCRQPSSPATPRPGTGPDTDWEQILLLYDMLLHPAPSPMARLHRTIAVRYVHGPGGSSRLEDVAAELDRYHLFHATRAELRQALGPPTAREPPTDAALALTRNPAEQAVLRQRIDWG